VKDKDKDWRATYAELLKQIDQMQRQLAHAQAEAAVIRERAAMERTKLQSVRTERRTIGRLADAKDDSEFAAYRRRRKRR